MRPHTPRKLLLLVSPFVLYPYGTPAMGGEVHVSISYDAPRRNLDACEAALAQTCAEAASARAALDQALANQSAAASSIAAANGQIQTSARCIADAQGRIDLISQSLVFLHDRAAAARASFDAAKAKAATAAAEVINYQNTARATFESSPAYSQVATDLASAKNAHDHEVDATLDALRGTYDYVGLYDQVEDLEEAVQFERNRNPVDQSSLSAASVNWMNAKSAFERFKADQVNHDPLVVEARARVNAIEQARQELVRRFSNDVAADPNLKNLIAGSAAAQQDMQMQISAANTTAADVTAREQAIANLQTTITSESARLAQAQTDVTAWQSAHNQYAGDAVNTDSWLRTLWVREATCRRDRDCAAENLRICLADRDNHGQRDYDRDRDNSYHQGGNRDHAYRGSDSARDGYARDRDGKSRDIRDTRNPNDRDEKDRQRREDAIASAERTEREALAARHVRDRAEEQRLAQLPSQERQKVEQQRTEERRQRELERQRTQPVSVASASAAPRVGRPVSLIGLPGEDSARVAHPFDPKIPAAARSDVQRQQIKNAETRDAFGQSAAASATPIATPKPAAILAADASPRDRARDPAPISPVIDPRPSSPDSRGSKAPDQPAQRSRPEPKGEERDATHAQTRAQRERARQQDQDRQEKESQSRAERDRQDRDARSRAEEDRRRQQESRAKSEPKSRERESQSQSKSDDDRRQRDAPAPSTPIRRAR